MYIRKSMFDSSVYIAAKVLSLEEKHFLYSAYPIYVSLTY